MDKQSQDARIARMPTLWKWALGSISLPRILADVTTVCGCKG